MGISVLAQGKYPENQYGQSPEDQLNVADSATGKEIKTSAGMFLSLNLKPLMSSMIFLNLFIYLIFIFIMVTG